ncbi:hypothetical protein Tco_0997514 [Tanacetum coccineum]
MKGKVPSLMEKGSWTPKKQALTSDMKKGSEDTGIVSAIHLQKLYAWSMVILKLAKKAQRTKYRQGRWIDVRRESGTIYIEEKLSAGLCGNGPHLLGGTKGNCPTKHGPGGPKKA